MFVIVDDVHHVHNRWEASNLLLLLPKFAKTMGHCFIPMQVCVITRPCALPSLLLLCTADIYVVVTMIMST